MSWGMMPIIYKAVFQVTRAPLIRKHRKDWGAPDLSDAIRATLVTPDNISTSLLVRRAKALVGLSGVKGALRKRVDGVEWVAWGMNAILLIDYDEQATLDLAKRSDVRLLDVHR